MLTIEFTPEFIQESNQTFTSEFTQVLPLVQVNRVNTCTYSKCDLTHCSPSVVLWPMRLQLTDNFDVLFVTHLNMTVIVRHDFFTIWAFDIPMHYTKLCNILITYSTLNFIIKSWISWYFSWRMNALKVGVLIYWYKHVYQCLSICNFDDLPSIALIIVAIFLKVEGNLYSCTCTWRFVHKMVSFVA